MILKLLIVLALVAIVFVIIVALRPSHFSVSRSTNIAAAPAMLFEQVNDLHKWQEMSPYAKMDPSANYTYDGPRSGNGASLAWVGNGNVGAGRMTITRSQPNELVGMRLDFLRPFKATNIAEFIFRPNGDETAVTWTMSGQSNFMFKAMGLFMNCDKMVGDQFDEGLANLKRIAEGSANKRNETSVASVTSGR